MARQRFCWLFVDVVQWEHLVAVAVGMPSRLGVGVAPSGHLLPLPHYLLHFPLPLRGQGGSGSAKSGIRRPGAH